MVTDPIADMLTRLRNAQLAQHPTVMLPFSTQKERILDVLLAEGFIEKVERTDDLGGKPALRVYLRYDSRGAPIIREIHRMSRPGKRLYVPKDKIPVHKSGLGLVVVSTPRGMLSDRAARREGVGGELICSVF